MEESLKRFRDHDPIVLGDLSSDIGQAYNPHSQWVAGLLIEFRLMDLLPHFQQHWWLQHINKWYRVRQGRALWESSNYILGAYWRCFKMVGIIGVRNYPSYHLVLRARLLIYPTKSGHQFYKWGLPAQMGTTNGVRKENGR